MPHSRLFVLRNNLCYLHRAVGSFRSRSLYQGPTYILYSKQDSQPPPVPVLNRLWSEVQHLKRPSLAFRREWSRCLPLPFSKLCFKIQWRCVGRNPTSCEDISWRC